MSHARYTSEMSYLFVRRKKKAKKKFPLIAWQITREPGCNGDEISSLIKHANVSKGNFSKNTSASLTCTIALSLSSKSTAHPIKWAKLLSLVFY